MATNRGTHSILWFLAGLGIGSIVGALFAPQGLEDPRECMRSKAEDGREYVRETARQAREQASEWADRARESMDAGTHDAGEPPPRNRPL